MDLHYILFNTIIYGYITLVLSSIFAYKRYINFSLPGVFILMSYVLYDVVTGAPISDILFMGASILVLYFGVDFLIFRSFKETKRRELFSIVFTLGLLTFVENFGLFVYGSGLRGLDIFHISTSLLVSVFIVGNLLLIYFLKYSLTGKALLATYENPNTIQSLGINIQRFVLPYLIVLFIIGLGIAFININENILRPNDLVFYLLKGLGIMVLVGLRKIEYTLIGACIYVIIEYLLFVEVGLSITYKEALILFIILILLVFKPNGIFSLTSRKI